MIRQTLFHEHFQELRSMHVMRSIESPTSNGTENIIKETRERENALLEYTQRSSQYHPRTPVSVFDAAGTAAAAVPIVPLYGKSAGKGAR